jgi:lipoprotein-anchoring transpeptidase ErfK/SrfK
MEQAGSPAVFIDDVRFAPGKTMRIHPSALALICLLSFGGGPATALIAEDVNRSVLPDAEPSEEEGPDPFIVKAQVLLSRRNISPGVIDGFAGENYRKAVAQFRRQAGLPAGEAMDHATFTALGGDTAETIVAEYTLSEKDIEHKFAAAIPRDYAAQARMKRLAYTGPVEMLAERFHMGEKLLRAMNPKADFKKAGSVITVVSIARSAPEGVVSRVDAVKSTGMVVVYGEADAILASYPATIGSAASPSPDGEYTVTRIVRNPTYEYDPEKNFQQGRNTRRLTLPRGPNNPVGTIWIALSKPTFGIHGTPEPALVSKTSSHGCVRLTNWDAEELASLVKRGAVVRFVE